MESICGNDAYVVTRNERARVTYIENKRDRTLCPVDDGEWQPFVEVVLTANKHIIRNKEAKS